MVNTRVQIIIPVYNSGKYLRRCLDSLKAQTYDNWQAIIIDDASTDESADILREYSEADERFTVFRQKKTGGVAKARNLGLSKLSAEYTAFLDSDDFWEKDMLEVMLDKAEENSADIVQCRFIYDFEDNKTILPKGTFSKDTVLEGKGLRRVYLRMMTGINMNHVCIRLIRTEMLEGLRFDESLKTAEDLHLSIRIFHRVKKYCFTDKVLYHYRRSSGSLTGKGLPFRERLDANRFVSKELIRALPVWGIDNIFYRTLSLMRPYIIIVSKIFRIIREKIVAGK